MGNFLLNVSVYGKLNPREFFEGVSVFRGGTREVENGVDGTSEGGLSVGAPFPKSSPPSRQMEASGPHRFQAHIEPPWERLLSTFSSQTWTLDLSAYSGTLSLLETINKCTQSYCTARTARSSLPQSGSAFFPHQGTPAGIKVPKKQS